MKLMALLTTYWGCFLISVLLGWFTDSEGLALFFAVVVPLGLTMGLVFMDNLEKGRARAEWRAKYSALVAPPPPSEMPLYHVHVHVHHYHFPRSGR